MQLIGLRYDSGEGWIVYDVDQEVLENLRRLAREEKSVYAVLDYLIKALNLDSGSRIMAILYFKEAFLLTLGEAMQIGAWDYFDGGSWSIDMIERTVGPLIEI